MNMHSKFLLTGLAASLVTVGMLHPAAAQDDADMSAMQAQHAQLMDQMHERMQTMQKQMQQIQREDDPAARQELLQQHMQTMQAQMNAMRSMGGATMAHMGGQQMGKGAMHREQGMGMPSGQMGGSGRSAEPGPRHQMMQDRMDMMQMMMEQMMEHMQVESDHHAG